MILRDTVKQGPKKLRIVQGPLRAQEKPPVKIGFVTELTGDAPVAAVTWMVNLTL